MNEFPKIKEKQITNVQSTPHTRTHAYTQEHIHLIEYIQKQTKNS